MPSTIDFTFESSDVATKRVSFKMTEEDSRKLQKLSEIFEMTQKDLLLRILLFKAKEGLTSMTNNQFLSYDKFDAEQAKPRTLNLYSGTLRFVEQVSEETSTHRDRVLSAIINWYYSKYDIHEEAKRGRTHLAELENIIEYSGGYFSCVLPDDDEEVIKKLNKDFDSGIKAAIEALESRLAALEKLEIKFK